MKNFIPVEELVAPSVMQKVSSLNLSNYVVEKEIRGIKIKWLCLSKRLLWMAVGHEFIEPELLNWIDSIPKNSSLWDIGASNGIFSIYAGMIGLNVLAIEPDPLNFFLLTYNNYLNGSPINVLNTAISNSMGLSDLNMKKFELGGHLKILDKPQEVLGDLFTPEYVSMVLTITLDQVSSWLKTNPTHLKIDVDGSESQVLLGGNIVLSSVDSIFIELTQDFINSENMATFARNSLYLESKKQVQNYEGLYNCIFKKEEHPK